jgi:hypothetical protein
VFDKDKTKEVEAHTGFNDETVFPGEGVPLQAGNAVTVNV